VVLEDFRLELVGLLINCLVRREARVMLAQAQLQLAREYVPELERDAFWKSVLTDIKNAAESFAVAATDVFATALADVTLYRLRCGPQPRSKAP
jgi:hypothetical protein